VSELEKLLAQRLAIPALRAELCLLQLQDQLLDQLRFGVLDLQLLERRQMRR
jgi:hypothetical protein